MSDMDFGTVLSVLGENGVRVITLNRPESLNAMNPALIEDVAKAFDHANADKETRAIIFTGAGKAFCAGDDRRAHVHPESEEEARALVLAIQRATHAITFGAKPVVGAINGWAVGAGLNGRSIAISRSGPRARKVFSRKCRSTSLSPAR